jgi:hypothetical protein
MLPIPFKVISYLNIDKKDLTWCSGFDFLWDRNNLGFFDTPSSMSTTTSTSSTFGSSETLKDSFHHVLEHLLTISFTTTFSSLTICSGSLTLERLSPILTVTIATSSAMMSASMTTTTSHPWWHLVVRHVSKEGWIGIDILLNIS